MKSLRTFIVGSLLVLAGCAARATASAVPQTPASPRGSGELPTATDAAESSRAVETIERRMFSVAKSGHGPAIILIPGLTCGAHVWDATVALLAEDYELHVLTLSGFAGRPAVEGPFVPAVRDEIVAYVDDAGLKKPAVVGHSLGGFLALWLGATEPDRFGAIVAADGLPSLGAAMGMTADGMQNSGAQMREAMRAMDQAAFAKSTSQSLAGQITDPDEVARVAAVSGRSDPASVGKAMEEMLTRDIRPLMANVRAPVLLFGPGVGSKEHRERVEPIYRAQVSTVPVREVVFLEGARHFVMLDAADTFHDTLVKFLAQHHSGAQ